jgi:hypothetical protein
MAFASFALYVSLSVLLEAVMLIFGLILLSFDNLASIIGAMWL